MQSCGRCTNCQSDATELDFAPGYPFGVLIAVSVICFGLALFATFVAFRPDLAGPEFDPTDVRVVMAGTALLCAAGPFISARRTYIHCTKCDARWRR